MALSLELADSIYCSFSLKRFPVWFILFDLPFIITPCLVVAVQPYVE